MKGNCLEIAHPDLFKQIDVLLTKEDYPEVNLNTLTYGSKKKIWWRCLKDERHIWEASPNERTGSGKGCLVCAGYKIIKGVNDLGTLNPTVASQWHHELNGTVTPYQVSATANMKAWWKCDVDSRHIWKTQVKTRHYGAGCSVCDNKVIMQGINDFATAHPEMASEWHLELNKDFTPYNTAPSSSRRIWWVCPKDERHVYHMTVNDRHNGHGCTVCPGRFVIKGVNDLAYAFPELVKQWHPELNTKFTPETVTPYSEKKAWWVCDKDERHVWIASISTRTSGGNGCPVCVGQTIIPGVNDLGTQNPTLALQWHPELNGELPPQMITPSSNQKAWWQCPSDPSHVWKASVNNRQKRSNKRGTGCPDCIVYKNETELLDKFNELSDLVFVNASIPVHWSKRKLTQIDVYNEQHKICIEYDGLWSHGGKVHSPVKLEVAMARDTRKTKALLDAGYTVIRIREIGLPFVEVEHANFFQTSYDTRHDKAEVVLECLNFLDF